MPIDNAVNGNNKFGLEEIIYISTIQGAIDAASEGDTINIAAGTYNENLFMKR